MKMKIVGILVFMLLITTTALPALGTIENSEKEMLNIGNGSINISPTDDSYVNDNYPTSNYGSSNALYVGDQNYNEPAHICRTYFKFDLGAIPAGAEINSAELYLYPGATGPSPDIIVGSHYLSDDSWNEGTISWNNAPAGFNPIATDSKTVSGPTGWYVWDVTSDAQTVWGDDKVYSTVMKDTTEGTDHNWALFCSKEDPEFKPYLNVSYTEREECCLAIESMYGGLSDSSSSLTVNAVIKNTGTAECKDIEWSFSFLGGIVLWGPKSGTEPSLLPGATVTVSSRIVIGLAIPGLLPGNVTINADATNNACPPATMEKQMLLFILLLKVF